MDAKKTVLRHKLGGPAASTPTGWDKKSDTFLVFEFRPLLDELYICNFCLHSPWRS